jgi:glycosyltransferase involved in cell wall biosynthesis
MLKKRVVLAVTNDILSDQRVHKMSLTLLEMGFDICIVGRMKKDSLKLDFRPYNTFRFNLLGIEKGPLFYAFYNIRLFFFLIFNKFDVIVANDLDTLLASFLASKIKNIPLVYDSHEYFCETPELVNRPKVQNIWKKIERFIFPKLQDIITVNESIANAYQNIYNKNLKIVRNIPFKSAFEEVEIMDKNSLGIENDKKVIILQGAGININRGAEEALEAMQYVENAVLLIIGSGDVIEILKEKRVELNLENKVLILPKMPFKKLIAYTKMADLGLTLDKGDNLNYQYSLPNKLFDYIHAGIPVLSSKLIELERIINKYEIGFFIENHGLKHIASKISEILNLNSEEKAKIKQNLLKAQQELSWESESEVVRGVYDKFL